ncbi:MAG: thioredoxin domain-containing protein [Candidatus Omnitrophica bacterium]|nr:thioredoxin domain-containing protein [Candidatus Omnitrophota bacterium]
MLRRVILFAAVVLFLFALFALKMNEYKRNFIYQKNIEEQLTIIQNNQKQIVKVLTSQGFARQKGAQKNERPQIDPNKVYDIDTSGSMVKGNPEAKVTIVEFSDFQCPYSQKFHPIIADVVSVYPEDVNYVFMSFPLSYHKQAKPATKALLVAKQYGKYWEMLDLIFQNAKDLSEDKYGELAGQLGINKDEFVQKMQEQDAQLEQMIQKDLAIAGKADVGGTPTFFINGKRTNARTSEDLKKQVNEILK